MGKKIDIDKLLKEAVKEYPDDMQAIDNIDLERLNRIEQKALQKYHNKRDVRSWRIVLKTVAVAASIFVLFTVMLLLFELPTVQAYKGKVQRLIYNLTNDKEQNNNNEGRVVESNNFDNIQQQVPFHIPKPEWIPEGFELKFVDFTQYKKNYYIINYRYITSDGEYQIDFGVNNNDTLTQTSPSASEPERELVKVMDTDVYILTRVINDVEYNSANYINEQGLVITIIGGIDKQSLIKIIENMN